ncbi:MAG: tetratricopeptide repeat protein [bacterium]
MLTLDHQRLIKKIILTLSLSGKNGAIILLACSGEELRQKIESILRQALGNKFFFNSIYLDEQNNNLPAILHKETMDNSIQMIYNLSELIKTEDAKKLGTVPSCLQYLNSDREVFFEKHIPAIFWIDKETLTKRIPWQTTDFWAYRTMSVAFESEDDKIAEIRKRIKGYNLSEKNWLKIASERQGLLIEYKMERPDDKAAIIKILTELGYALYIGGKLQDALKYSKEALEISREIGDRMGESVALNGIGTVYQSMGESQDALKYMQEALGISREIGNYMVESTALSGIGMVYQSLGEPQNALKYAREALEISRAIGDRMAESIALNSIGLVYRSLGEPQNALKYAQEALEISRAIGDRAIESSALNGIGLVYQSLGEPQDALKYLQEALEISREIGNCMAESTALSNIGLVYQSLGELQHALKYSKEALEIFEKIGAVEMAEDMKQEIIKLEALFNELVHKIY